MRYSTIKKIVGCLMLGIIVAFMLAASTTASSTKATAASTVITTNNGKISPSNPPPVPPPPHLRTATTSMNVKMHAKANNPSWQCSGSGVYRVCTIYYPNGRAYRCTQHYDRYHRQYHWVCQWIGRPRY
jgi:hypothetical protein